LAAKTFQFRLITPQGKLIDAKATSAAIPAHDGSMGVLPDRAPIVVKLGLGELKVTCAEETGAKGDGPLKPVAAGGTRGFVIEEGFAQMSGNRLTVLTTKAFAAEMLNETDASAELAKAEAKKPESPAGQARLTRERDLARLKVRVAKSRAGKGI
jgi:F-type H+-transporting ATPase subunit epsilon